MYGNSRDRGRFMKSFRFDTICNITQEPQELQNSIVPVGSSASLLRENIINYYQNL